MAGRRFQPRSTRGDDLQQPSHARTAKGMAFLARDTRAESHDISLNCGELWHGGKWIRAVCLCAIVQGVAAPEPAAARLLFAASLSKDERAAVHM